MFVALSKREPVDLVSLALEVAASTRRVIHKQAEAGIDIVNNGEQSRESFISYVQHRLSGFGGSGTRKTPKEFMIPGFVRLKMPDFQARQVSLMTAPMAVAEVRHETLEPLQDECDVFDAELAETGDAFSEAFMTAASPGIICAGMLNSHYPSDDDYVTAVADAMRPEYEHIVSRGYVLQLDCPDLAMERHIAFQDAPLEDFQRYVRRNIAAINRAVEGLPADRIRLHVCWGNYEGPHIYDVALEAIIGIVHEANVGALVLPFANPRHAHEWRALKSHPLPDGRLLVAGVIDTTTNYVEHPEVVADRICQAAEAVGDPHRVIAGTDCGFGTAAGFGGVAEEVVWMKLRSLREGADIATRRLFG
jgi:5-methyltetrahydropteroyltriglutamate--homocysteine methyltransferase